MSTSPVEASQRRGDNPGRTFSIIFAVVAFLVVLGSLILVIILPKFRKKPRTLPLMRYPVVPNYPAVFGPPPLFPSHPALLRGFREQPTAPVRRYDPRVESPFPNSPTQADSITRPFQSGQLHAATHSHGLFTPPQCCFPMRHQQQALSHHNLEARRRISGPDPRRFTTFNEKHDYILPVPEPLILKARPAGRPPPLTRQLERFPMPLSSSRRGLVHPVRLFQELEQRNSDTTADTFGTPCPVPQISKHLAAIEMSVISKGQSEAPPRGVRPGPCKLVDGKKPSPEPGHALQKPDSQATDSGAAETSEKPSRQMQEKLERMGTLTRPKTPVAEIRDWFDRAASNANKEKSSSKRGCTPSTNPFTTPGLSSTPPTSPGFSAPKTPAPSTPSKPHVVTACINAASHGRRRTPSSVILPSPEKFTALPLTTPSKQARRAAKGSPHTKGFRQRSKPGRLRLVSWSKLRPNMRLSQRYSSSSLSTTFRPILATRSQHSQGASSVYSRDARGLSFLEAIDPPGRGLAYNDRVELGWRKDLRLGRVTRPPHKQSASIDHLKTKIDNWDLHTGDLARSLSPSSAVKRSISDTGPRRLTIQNSAAQGVGNGIPVRSIPLIQIGRSSDDVFGIEADGFQSHEASILIKRMGHVETSPVILGGLGRGTAPGGGEWI